MAGAVAPIYKVVISYLIGATTFTMDCSKYVSVVSINHEVQTLSPTFTIVCTENFSRMRYPDYTVNDGPIVGTELVSISLGYDTEYVLMIDKGPISTFNRALSQNGVEFVVNGRGPIATLIDEAPELDQIYIPTWDKTFNKDGDWVSSACGIQRTEPVPPGIDPKQDPNEYEIFEGEWYVHSILDHIADNLGITIEANFPDAKYREVFRINRSQTWISGIQQLVSIWEPLIFMNRVDGADVLYILDTDFELPVSSNIGYGPSSCTVANLNYTKNNIINRILIKGGADENVVPVRHEEFTPNVDTIIEVIGDDLTTWATEITTTYHPVPGTAANYFSGFTGTHVSNGYFKPMFGDPIPVYTKAITYHNDHIMKYVVEVLYYNNTGSWGPDQQVCTKAYRKRRQEFVASGYFTDANPPTYVPVSLNIVKGFSGPRQTGSDAAEPDGQAILPVSFQGYSYFKVLDQEEFLDGAVGTTFGASSSRTFGIMPKGKVMSVFSPNTPDPSKYYLIGSGPTTNPKTLYEYQNINGFELSYRCVSEKIVLTDVRTSVMGVKQTQIIDYTQMRSDYGSPVVDSSSEIIPINKTSIFTSSKKPIYQYEKYFEVPQADLDRDGYRPVVTYYDPSIINDTDAEILKNKIFKKSGRIEQEIVIYPSIGNPVLSVGKSLILANATYKQINFSTKTFEDTVISGGSFIINGIRHNFDKSGFKTEVSLRKLWEI
jgi:hypothetical protein